jgi:MSHA biogenesis protein MshK
MKRLAFLFSLACAHAAHAAPFADPTRPPVAPDAYAVVGTPDEPRLESVLIAPDRRIAVINGQQVVIGARILGGEVVRITESEVVIRDAERMRSLKLFPVMKQPAAPRKKGTTP